MFREHLNKRNLTLALFAVLAVLVVAWLFFPKQTRSVARDMPLVGSYVPEGFNGEEKVVAEDKSRPFVDPSTGTLMDGPGFEKGEVEGVAAARDSSLPSNFYMLDDGANGELGTLNNLCSKSCCSEQWPTPFKQKYDPYVCNNKDKFVSSNQFCTNSFQDAGCLCMTTNQAQHLYNRGMQTREFL